MACSLPMHGRKSRPPLLHRSSSQVVEEERGARRELEVLERRRHVALREDALREIDVLSEEMARASESGSAAYLLPR